MLSNTVYRPTGTLTTASERLVGWSQFLPDHPDVSPPNFIKRHSEGDPSHPSGTLRSALAVLRLFSPLLPHPLSQSTAGAAAIPPCRPPKMLRALFSCALLSCALLAAADAASDVATLTSKTFESIIAKEDLVLVKFFAPWCVFFCFCVHDLTDSAPLT